MATDQLSIRPKTDVYFPFFPLLPLELRRKIYIFATPPRVVYIRERVEQQEEWRDKLGSRIVLDQTKLHPNLAYFSRFWGPELRLLLSSNPQSTLESYGFTTTKKPYQPWSPTKDTPEIPLSWLSDNHSLAYVLLRDEYLSSLAPIPPFLHVCSESRHVLMKYGYELTFGTRTHDGRTWFHFERDTLYLPRSNIPEANFLSGGDWNISIFRPTDLQRVKKLALQGCMIIIPPVIPGMYADGWLTDGSKFIPDLLCLLPNVEELLLVEWDPRIIDRYWLREDHNFTRKTMGLESRLVCVPIDEIDTVTLQAPWSAVAYERTCKFAYRRLKEFKGSGCRTQFFESEASRFERLLVHELQEKTTTSVPGSTSRPRKVPRVSLVHLCSLQAVPYIFRMRQQFWAQFNDTKNRLRRGRASRLAASKRLTGSVQYQDVGDAYLETYKPDFEDCFQFWLAHPERFDSAAGREFVLPVTEEEQWWLNSTFLFPPRFDIT